MMRSCALKVYWYKKASEREKMGQMPKSGWRRFLLTNFILDINNSTILLVFEKNISCYSQQSRTAATVAVACETLVTRGQ